MDKLPSSLSRDELLGMLGLEVKPTRADLLAPALTVFGAGIVVGVGVGLLFAPRPGREVRAEISKKLQEVPDAVAHLPEQAAQLSHRAGAAIRDAREQVEATAQKVKDNHSIG